MRKFGRLTKATYIVDGILLFFFFYVFNSLILVYIFFYNIFTNVGFCIKLFDVKNTFLSQKRSCKDEKWCFISDERYRLCFRFWTAHKNYFFFFGGKYEKFSIYKLILTEHWFLSLKSQLRQLWTLAHTRRASVKDSVSFFNIFYSLRSVRLGDVFTTDCFPRQSGPI